MRRILRLEPTPQPDPGRPGKTVRQAVPQCVPQRTPGWYDSTAQAFAVVLPVRSVGVMGDRRTHGQVAPLRAVQTTDFMGAHVAPLPQELLARVANRIIDEVRGLNRLVYDV